MDNEISLTWDVVEVKGLEGTGAVCILADDEPAMIIPLSEILEMARANGIKFSAAKTTAH